MTNGKFLELRGNDFKKKTGIGIGVCAASVVGLVMLQMCERSKPAPECLYPCEPPRVCTEPAPITLVAPPPVEKKAEKIEKAKPKEKTLARTPAKATTTSSRPAVVAHGEEGLAKCKKEVSDRLKGYVSNALTRGKNLEKVREAVGAGASDVPKASVSYQVVDGKAEVLGITIKCSSCSTSKANIERGLVNLEKATTGIDGSCENSLDVEIPPG